ncbi:hypothetical protein [Mucilaginibacter celer]|uniref:Uncharacterized protein n=1 Tax=Mucilaginibacter celer TaxID=2305508 RepID=A0A494VZA2_9SPHI|nr:hypothetical protein [Mucilaginibacter celer]AYL99629.1 hypothetical protein HYN43_027955 [Mucilaginibacter celer]
MKNIYFKSGILAAVLSIALTSGCKKDVELQNAGTPVKTGQTKDGITPYSFNWETVDFMPTPAGQSQIPPPWIGQGSIASIYDTDVLNDHRAADGWQLVYNTFTPNASGPLTNPYFMLYNKYRGLLRIYMYITTNFATTSDYLTDGINVVSNVNSSMLNFNGADIVDVSTNKKSYIQVEPAPSDGSKPLASNKWYMMQYEFAYDPQIAGLNYNDMRLSWFTNYNSITNISLGGTQTGTLNGTIGSDGSSSSGISSALVNGGKVLGTAALSAIGSNFLEKQSKPDTTDNNKLGLPSKVFTSIKKGVTAGLQAASGNIPGAVVGILSGLFGGSGGSTQQTVSLNLNSTITLGGPATSSGSFPSSPTAVWLPGTQITSAAQNYLPLYNNTLGVFNLKGVPTIKCNTTNFQSSVVVNGITYNRYSNEYTVDNTVFNNLFITNPAIINNNSDGATIKNLRTEVVLLNPQTGDPNLYGFYGTSETIGNYTALTGQVATTQYTVEHGQPFNNLAAVRVIFDVVPNNGTTPQTLVVKSFFANIVTTTTIVPPAGGGHGGH